MPRVLRGCVLPLSCKTEDRLKDLARTGDSSTRGRCAAQKPLVRVVSRRIRETPDLGVPAPLAVIETLPW